jgi:hypothetical protein
MGELSRSGWPRACSKLPGAERQRLLRTALELRERGLSYPAISVVFDLYEGVEIGDVVMRRWLHYHGVPANPRLIPPQCRVAA